MQTVGEILGARSTYWIDSGWSVRKATEYLCAKKVGAAPVLEASAVVGVFSERDLMRRVVLQGLDLDATGVADVMTRDVIHVPPDEHYLKAKELMLKRRVRHLVVQDDDRHLRGFVSIRELSEAALNEANSHIAKLNSDYYNDPAPPEG